MSEEWREYWTPEEYADMQEVLAPEELEEELERLRTMRAHYRAAVEMGVSVEEAAIMRARGMMTANEAAGS